MMVAVMMIATSCEKVDANIDTQQELSTITFNVGTPEIATRAYSDGSTATVLQYAVYNAAGEILPSLTVNDGTINGKTTVQLQLTTGNKYSVIFWAAAPGAPYTVDFADKTMTVDYSKAVCNDENRDAFYAYHEFTVTGAQTEPVELRRPFAQLNIGTADYEDSKKAGYVPTHSSVKVSNVYTVLDLKGGIASKPTDVDLEVEFKSAEIKRDEAFPVAGNEYLAMNYFLVKTEKEVVDIEFTYGTSKDDPNAKMRKVGSVPVQRNYRTNIYGKLLTSEVDVNVEIKPVYNKEAYNNDHLYYIEEGTRYLTSADGLRYFAEQVNNGNAEWLTANVALASDIDLAAVSTRSSSANWTPISMSKDLANGKTFRGSFDGKGFSIKNMVCEGTEVAGLFGYVYAATIKNVTIENASIKSNHFAGGIVAWTLNTTGNIKVPMIIENCHVKNSTIISETEEVDGAWDNGDKVGGIVGYACFGDSNYKPNDGAKISGCTVEETTIKAYRDFGGLIGYAAYVNIENCNTKSITLDQDLTHDYKAPNTPTTFGGMIGNDAGHNTINGYNYVTSGVAADTDGNYHIFTADGLRWIANVVNSTTPYTSTLFDNKTVYLSNDIDLENIEWIPIGDDRSQRTEWHGVFDGNGFTIKNVKITKKTDREDENKSSYGLFGNVKGTVKNLTVEEVSISGAPKFIGALIGRLNDGLVENCHVKKSSVECNNWTIGALVGQFNNGKISGCSVENTTVKGYAAVGGIAGIALNSGERIIENCSVKNSTFIKNGSFGGNFDKMFGCIVGSLYSGTLTVNLNNNIAENNTLNGSKFSSLCGYVDEGDKLLVNGSIPVTTSEELSAAIKAGGNYILLNDVAMTEAIYQNVDFTLDGNGHTISQADGSTNNFALFDSVTGKITLKNVAFAGIKGGAVLRTIGAETNLVNVKIEDAETTQQQGLLRLIGKSTIKDCTFKNNTCSMVITLNYDGANNDPQVVENCVFEGNTCNGTAALYYVKGAMATINGNKFIGNTVNCNGNGATIYMGFTENNVVTNNLFQNNTVNEAGESSRVAGGIFFGYKTKFTGNAFIGNKVTGKYVKANDVCVSTYYTSIDLSGNYWGGNAPVEDTNYFVQHKSEERTVIINDYLTTYGN